MAEAMKTKSIKTGDVILIAAVNHNDLCIPFLAALYLGAVPLGMTPDMKHCMIISMYNISIQFIADEKVKK